MQLLPQRLVLPSSGTPHGSGVNDGVCGEQSLDVIGEGVGWVDSIEPVGYAAELGIKFEGMKVLVGNPG